MVDDLSRTMPVFIYFGCCRTGPVKVGRFVRQPFYAAVGTGHGGSDWLLDLVRQRSGHFPQRAHTIDVRKICLQLMQFLALLFCTLAILNIREGPVPSNNFSILIAKWNTAHQKPSVFPVSGANIPRLVFEKLPGCNRDAPLLGMAHKIFRMDGTLPTSAR